MLAFVIQVQIIKKQPEKTCYNLTLLLEGCCWAQWTLFFFFFKAVWLFVPELCGMAWNCEIITKGLSCGMMTCFLYTYGSDWIWNDNRVFLSVLLKIALRGRKTRLRAGGAHYHTGAMEMYRYVCANLVTNKFARCSISVLIAHLLC